MNKYYQHPVVIETLIDDSPGRLGLDSDNFFDYGHLRRSGAEIVTRDLAARISSLALPLKKQDEKKEVRIEWH